MISFKGKSKEYEEIVVKLGDLVITNRHLFTCLAELLNECNRLRKFDEETLELITEDKRDDVDVDESQLDLLITLIKDLYDLQDEETFGKRKGDLVEFITLKLGAINFETNSNLETALECEVFHNDDKIADNNEKKGKDIDVAIYDKTSLSQLENVMADLYECKADIDNFLYVVQGKTPPIKTKHYEKLKFLEDVRDYFQLSQKFFVSLVTPVSNVERAKEVLKLCNFHNIKVINKEHIEEVIEKLIHI
ncbi:MAG TPA: hypothetical protein VJ824_15015 [Bacillota bacterium]|nr:hypothetical protein [Bacillota bacterium]